MEKIGKDLVIGLDYGTDSVRALLVDARSGKELATSIFDYPRWRKGLYCRPDENRFRQHPLDYIEGLEYVVREVVGKVPGAAGGVVAISIDTTGSTPVAVDANGTPLALLPAFADDPDAMFILWKDHTAVEEADHINTLCRNWSTDYTKYSGGIYSSEWFWSKILHVLNTNEKVAEAAWSWVEHCDWMPALLTGEISPLQLKRSRCAAGHKAMWHPEWHGLPSVSFLNELHPGLGQLRDRLYHETVTADTPAGFLSAEWTEKLGLSGPVVVGTGALDAHFGAVGGQIEPWQLSKVVGTSTCDMLVVPADAMENVLIKGICGQVDGSIVPGLLGMEAGQSAFGDVYAWFRDLLLWPLKNAVTPDAGDVTQLESNLIGRLAGEAARIPPGSSGLTALDWLNGRRTPDSNPYLKGAITGLTLGTDAPKIFRALVEATAFGAKKIIERFEEQGIPVRGINALGGVAKKSPFVVQTLADVLNVPIKVVNSENACALGAAMFAATVAGLCKNVQEAQTKLNSGFGAAYRPVPENVRIYRSLLDQYNKLGTFVETW